MRNRTKLKILRIVEIILGLKSDIQVSEPLLVKDEYDLLKFKTELAIPQGTFSPGAMDKYIKEKAAFLIADELVRIKAVQFSRRWQRGGVEVLLAEVLLAVRKQQ